jgi:hypothetical protein
MGSYMNDTIRFGGHKLRNMYFGVVENYFASFPITTPQASIFGLGAICLKKGDCDGYPSFIQQLRSQGAIDRRAFSVYLGPDQPHATGNLLFGGTDKAKRRGPVVKLPMLDPSTTAANNQPYWVKTYSMELRFANGTNISKSFGPNGNGTYTLLDTGNPHWYMPIKIFNGVMEAFGLSKDVDTSGDWIEVDCKYRKPSKSLLVASFQDGFEIEVPLHHLVTQFKPDTCGTRVSKSTGPSYGDPFLRSTYLTFDIDKKVVEMSAVKYTDETNIVKIK